MKSFDQSVNIVNGDGSTEEQFLFTYSEEEKQRNEINAANAKLIFSPKFIPVNPGHLKFLTPTEAILFGFIDFYCSRGAGRFYFANEQLAEMLNCSTDTVSISIRKFEKLGMINAFRKMRAGGGQIRFIQLRKIRSSVYGKSVVASTENPMEIRNKINKNKINSIYTEKKQSFGEFVSLTESAYNKLVLDYGEPCVKRYIEKMNTWIPNHKPYKNYEAALRNWMVDEKKNRPAAGGVEEKKPITDEERKKVFEAYMKNNP